MHLYLAQYIGSGTDADPFTPSGSEVEGWDAIDMRPDPTQQQGRCLLALPVRADGTGREYLGDSPDDPLPAIIRTRLENRLGITFEGNEDRLRRVIPALLVRYAGGNRWKPLRANQDRRLRIWLGRQLFWEQAVPAGGASVFDDFNRADSTNLGANWTEVVGDPQIVGNQFSAGAVTVVGRVRHNTALATDDHYAQIQGVNYSFSGTAAKALGPCVRYAAAADTCYQMLRIFTDTPSAATVRIDKIVTGAQTTIAAAVNEDGTNDEILYLEANGSTIVAKVDGVQTHSITDTSIVNNLHTGIRITAGNAIDRVRADNFTAADLAGGAVTGQTRHRAGGAFTQRAVAHKAGGAFTDRELWVKSGGVFVKAP